MQDNDGGAGRGPSRDWSGARALPFRLVDALGRVLADGTHDVGISGSVPPVPITPIGRGAAAGSLVTAVGLWYP
jgi:hypothetical protein